MKERLLALVRWTAFVAALVVLIAAAVLWRLESGGWLVERVRALARRGDRARAEIGEARLDWFGPAVILRGVKLPGEPAPLELENVRLSFEYVDGRFTLARIDVDGGRIELSEALLARLESAHLAQAEGESAAPVAPLALPTIVVERLQWDWIHPAGDSCSWGAGTCSRWSRATERRASKAAFSRILPLRTQGSRPRSTSPVAAAGTGAST